MVNEIYDIVDVKNEYIAAVGQSLQQQFNIQAIEAGFVLLNDFCNNIRANNMVLIKIPPQPQPQYIPPEPQRMPLGPQRIPIPEPEYEPETDEDLALRREYEKMIKTEEMRKKVNELNTSLMEEPLPKMREDISLSPEKPKSFIDKVKSYKPRVEEVDEDEN